ncbi:unnamed protein product [Somion occarium]|uniref:DNA 3'-5' helicase n=1 Tax=Somion occarium TaxID=3059160 RepID=A0ABP1E4V5_9APHY
MTIIPRLPVFKFASNEGRSLCLEILAKTPLPYQPHDYQLEGARKALDGIDILAVTPTGSGKTGFLTMYMLVTQAIASDSSLCPQKRMKKRAIMIVVCPTKALEHDMEHKFNLVGLSTLVINADTVDEARRSGTDIWTTAHSEVSILLLAPEQLKSSEFGHLLNNKEFQLRVVAFAVDESHLLDTWGASFRPVFKQIGDVRMRLPQTPVLIALTATLRVGTHTSNVRDFLGLGDSYHLIRHSNARFDLQFLFRTMSSSPRSLKFPELDWVLESERRIIIFCTTISLGFRVMTYLWRRAYELRDRRKCIRMYNSLNWPSYNADTLELMHTDTSSLVTIATDTLSQGIDVANTDDVVLYGDIPTTSDMVLQRGGRIRDGKGRNSRVIVYLPSTAVETALKVLDDEGQQGRMGKDARTTIDPSIAYLILAKCKVDAVNKLYGNPIKEVPCGCSTCRVNPPVPKPEQCNCSGCIPEVIEKMTSAPSAKTKVKIPASKRVTKVMRRHASTRLTRFRVELWEDADECMDSMLPSEEFLPDTLVKSSYHTIRHSKVILESYTE